MDKEIFKSILLRVLLPCLVGMLLGWLFTVGAESTAKKENQRHIDAFNDRFVAVSTDFNLKQAADSVDIDRPVNVYILRTFAIHQEVYRYAAEKRPAPVNIPLYEETVKTMAAIRNWQTMIERFRTDSLSGKGLEGVYWIEEVQEKLLDEELEKKKMEEE